MVPNKIENTLLDLGNWFIACNYEGWDPYDLKENQTYLKVHPKLPHSINLIEHLFPKFLRNLLAVKKKTNPKALGLILDGCLRLPETAMFDKLRVETETIEKKLTETSINLPNKSIGWGYPFDWQSKVFIPKNTPSSVVTYFVGIAYYHLFIKTKEEKYLNVCEKICHFFLNSLRISYDDGKSKCSSYTPIDDFQVHNANLFVAEFLIRIGIIKNNDHWIEEGQLRANFALSQQHQSGFLSYWGNDQIRRYSSNRRYNDHYHIGFEVRALFNIHQMLQTNELKIAYTKYFDYYKSCLSLGNNIPKHTSLRLYPIDIHSVAESLIIRCLLYSGSKEENEGIRELFNFIDKSFKNRLGMFFYQIRYSRLLGNTVSDIQMLRWGQAWMFNAYSYLNQISKEVF